MNNVKPAGLDPIKVVRDEERREDALCRVARIMQSCGMPLWGACGFAAFSERLLPCRAKGRLPEQARSILCALFPYALEERAHNISRYAMPPDYHGIVMDMLEAAVRAFGRLPVPSLRPICGQFPHPRGSRRRPLRTGRRRRARAFDPPHVRLLPRCSSGRSSPIFLSPRAGTGSRILPALRRVPKGLPGGALPGKQLFQRAVRFTSLKKGRAYRGGSGPLQKRTDLGLRPLPGGLPHELECAADAACRLPGKRRRHG